MISVVKFFVLALATAATTMSVAHAKPNLYTFPTYYEQLAAAANQLPHHANLLHGVKSRFHTQDELGQYSYGYNDGLSSKVESKTADGITQGSYAYVDSNGIVQNVNYISDNVNGFRVSASNLPVAPAAYQYSASLQRDVLNDENPTQAILTMTTNDLKQPETVPTEPAKLTEEMMVNAKQQKQNLTDYGVDATAILAKTGQTMVPTIAASVLPTYATYQPFPQYTWYQPQIQQISPVKLTSFRYYDDVPVAPVASVSPFSPVYSQFHSQDEYGQYSYGYSGGPSSKVEVKTLDGVTRGGYSYIDANGILQKVNYVSDPINGFRVAATNLPTISNAHLAAAYYPTDYQLSELNMLAHPSDKTKTD